jgi:hypothetical protein
MYQQATRNAPLQQLLIELDRPGSHIVYNTRTKQAGLYHADSDEGSPRFGLALSTEDLLVLFENAWIARFDTRDGEHRYRITGIGRKALS